MPMPDFEIPRMDVAHIRRKWLDLPYASTSQAQRLDIYLPESGDGPFPVILAVHGGGFAVGDKRDLPIRSYLRGLGRGYAVASVNYRLSGEALFPAGLQDVKAAVRWLRSNASHYHLDVGRVAACGWSSGGNYAAMLGCTEGVPLFDDPALSDISISAGVQVVVDWFGPTDFLKMDEQLAGAPGPCEHSGPDSPESLYLGAPITEVPDRVRLANPMTYVNDRMAPILIQHGDRDVIVPVRQSTDLARTIEERIGPDRFELDILAGAGHDDPAFQAPENMERVFAFMAKHLA
jgi:acetyl esterase/lipase